MRLRHLFVIVTLAAAGCETTPNITTDSDPSADFSRYRTYNWVYTQVPQGMNPLVYERVRASIDRSLQARSYTPGDPGDFAVAFTLGRRDRVEVSDFGPYGGFYPGYGVGYRFGWARPYSSVDVRNVTDGTLAIDIYDVTTRRPVWHGVATQQIDPNRVEQADIDAAIDQVLARFPPQPAAAQ